MGYKINSTWTRLRQDDIKKLNEIIDDEYCNELVIGHKLNLMEKFNQEFEDEINRFNFDIVLKFMKENDWKWTTYDCGKPSAEVPSKETMIEAMKTDFLKHGLFHIIELGETHYGCSSGGMFIDMGINGSDVYLSLGFDISHFHHEH